MVPTNRMKRSGRFNFPRAPARASAPRREKGGPPEGAGRRHGGVAGVRTGDDPAGWTEDRHAAVGPIDVKRAQDLRRIDAHTRARPLEPRAVDDELQADVSPSAANQKSHFPAGG